jgi:hypothetical protein
MALALLKAALVYRKAELCPNERNARVLRSVAHDEYSHALFREAYAGRAFSPDAFKTFRTVSLARALGLTFDLKQIKKNEGGAAKKYQALMGAYPEIEEISADEDDHEQAPLSCIDEELLRCASSITGLITGVSAAFSMAASECLSAKTDGDPKDAALSLYTGIFLFNCYPSAAKKLDFKKWFAEMVAISLGAAELSFGVGWLLNRFMGV